MLTKNSSIFLLVGALLSVPLTVAAQGKGVTTTAGKGGVVSVDSLVTRYEPLAGTWSPKNDNPKLNANSLVNGLRSGDAISLYGPMLKMATPPGPITTPPPVQKTACVPMPGKPCPQTTSSTPPPPPPAPKPQIVYQTISFSPLIGGTGFGNIDIALALAEADVKAKLPNVVSPTPEQLRAALVGGTVATAPGASSTVSFQGVLKLRSDGNGWGEVAKALGFDLK